MNKLFKPYVAVFNAAIPVRRLVQIPEKVSPKVVPLVRAFLPSVRAFALALKEEDGGKDGSWSAYLERYLRRADEFFAVADSELDPWTAYQHFGYLHNGAVDAGIFHQL